MQKVEEETMKKIMITAAMAAMLVTAATAYGNIENVMAAVSSAEKTVKVADDEETTKTAVDKTEEKEAKAADNKEDKKETTKIEKGDSLVIKTDDLSEDAAFLSNMECRRSLRWSQTGSALTTAVCTQNI